MAGKVMAHPSVADRAAQGADARIQTPPEVHTGWAPADDRPAPVTQLEEQNVTREPDLVPVRHGRMMVSPFTFYRGAAAVMALALGCWRIAADLSWTSSFAIPSGFFSHWQVWLGAAAALQFCSRILNRYGKGAGRATP